jgi:hypothetical protein
MVREVLTLGLPTLRASFALLALVQRAGMALHFALCSLLMRHRSVGHYLRYVFPRAALGAFTVLALLLWFKLRLDSRSLGGWAGGGVARRCSSA